MLKKHEKRRLTENVRCDFFDARGDMEDARGSYRKFCFFKKYLKCKSCSRGYRVSKVENDLMLEWI